VASWQSMRGMEYARRLVSSRVSKWVAPSSAMNQVMSSGRGTGSVFGRRDAHGVDDLFEGFALGAGVAVHGSYLLEAEGLPLFCGEFG
jgi:hypothetical protein